MDFINTTGEALNNTFNEMWEGLIAFLPNLIGALLILALGFLVAALFHKITEKILKFFKLKELFDKFRITSMFEKAGHSFSIVSLLASVIYWVIIIVFITVSVEMLGLTQISDFLRNIVFYLPNVIVAVAILVIGILISNFVENLIRKTTRAVKVASSEFLGRIAKWAILIFAILAALNQLNVAQNLITILFQGFIVMIALAGGLAFGLGGKEFARDILERFKR
ncbi:MAG: hypothetical protein U5L76_05060 [Patescibacteria group bacterium]|nr:hypothetical protein [Patescibacteria group bacterium]